jgi:hypothetical protein
MHKAILFLVPVSILVSLSSWLIIPILLGSLIATLFVFGMFPKRVQDELCCKSPVLASLMNHHVSEESLVAATSTPVVENVQPSVVIDIKKVVMPPKAYPLPRAEEKFKKRRRTTPPVKQAEAKNSSENEVYISDL